MGWFLNVILFLLYGTNPSRNMQSGTQIPPLLYFLQDRHWFGPGPQQPSDEQRGSHVRPSRTVGTFKVISPPTETMPLLICCLLTTFASGPVFLDFDVLAAVRAGVEQACPVDSVVIAQLLVSRYVHSAVVYFPKRAQPQWGQRGVPHHQEGVATEHQPSKQHTVIQFWKKGASPLSVINRNKQRKVHHHHTSQQESLSHICLWYQGNRRKALFVANTYKK